MAAVNEQLIIDVSARDALTAHIQKMTGAIEDFGTTAKQQLDATNKVLVKLPEAVKTTGVEAEKTEKKVNTFADTAQKKFTALGKAAIGIFTADLIAKTLGFGSAIQLAQKVAEGLAGSLREFFGFGAQWEAQQRQVERFRDLVKEARAELEGRTLRPSYDFTRTLGLTFGADLSSLIGDPKRLSAGALLVDQTRAKLEALEDERRAVLNATSQYGTPDQAKLADINQRVAFTLRSFDEFFDQLLDSNAKVRKETLDNASAAARVLELRKREREEGLRSQRIFEAELSARSRAGSSAELFAGRGARVSAAADRIAEEERRRTAFLGQGFGIPAFTQGPAALPAGPDNALPRRGAITGLLSGGANALVSGGASAIVGFAAQLQQAADAKVAFDKSFKGGAALTFAQMKQDIDASLGSQAVTGAFNGFRGFFADVLSGAKSGSDAIKDFGRSIVSLGADILAQKFALQVLGVFGLGAPATSAANGRVFRGGVNAPGVPSYASGGIAYGPQLAVIGDNRNQTEAVVPMPDGRSIPVQMRGGGGNNVSLVLNVSAIDGPGAASAVARMMPEIEGRIMAALAGGNRGLQMAVRGA